MPGEIEKREGALKDEAVNLLNWANDKHSPGVALTCSFGGIGGIVLAHIVSSERLPFTILFMDTDFLFPDTYELKQHLQDEWSLNIRTVKPNLSPEEQKAKYGEALWNDNPDLCCALRKVDPMANALRDYNCWITGIRRDQGKSRASVNIVEEHILPGGRSITKLNPLAAWTKKDVWRYVERHNIRYNPLLDAGYGSLGCIQCTSLSAGHDERAGRWIGKEKSECGLHTFTERKK